jgi:hypothetical protein
MNHGTIRCLSQRRHESTRSEKGSRSSGQSNTGKLIRHFISPRYDGLVSKPENIKPSC